MFKMSRDTSTRNKKRLQRGLESLETRILLAADWQNPINPVDVDANESAEVAVTPIDALLVINEINDPQYSDPSTGALPSMEDGELTVPAFVDTDGDGFVSPIDALHVINELNLDYGFEDGLTSVYQTSNVIAGSRAALDSHVTEDTLVNHTVAKSQAFPAVGADGQGNMVAVWQSFNQDGSSWGIFGQRYSADGEKVGDEFQVNTTTRLAQRQPSVAVQDDGDFMVVWQSLPDGAGWGIYGQAFDSDGNPVGQETLINTTTSGNQQHPDVAAGADNYTVVWHGKGQGDNTGVFAATVDEAGNVSEEMLVNTYTRGIQTRPAVDVFTDDNGTSTAFVSWDGKGPNDVQGVHMRALTNGSEQVQVNTQNSGFQHQSDISVGADGAPVVVWKVYPGVQGKDVMARVFDSTGAGSDSFLVNQTTRHKQWMPSIDHLEDGSFAVAWWGRGDGDTYGTFLRTFNADGSAISDEARQNFTTKGVQSRPAVAAANSGYVVLWQGKGEGDNTGIFARFFETEIGEPFSIAAIDNVSIDEGDLFTIDADIVDLDGVADSPTFSLGDSAPTGMTIDPVTGEITWQTDELDGPGTYEVVVNATTGTEGDDDFFTTSETFMIDVAEVDTAPVLAVVPDREINSEETSEFSVSATDVDIPVNDLTYTATLSNGDPLPGFLVFNPTTQTFTANPVDADEGVYEITVTVTDSTALSDSDTFTLTVNGNDAPVLNAAIPNQTATEDQAFSFDVSSFFSDPDNDTLTYSFTTSDGEPLPSWLSFNAATGTFSGTPTNRDIQDVTVTVTATDPGNLSASDTFTINVVDVNGFAPDIVDEVFVIPTTAANGSAVGTVSAGDADPTSTLTYSIVSGNGNGNYTIDSATGAITVADNTNLGTTNPDVIGVQVSDGMSTDTAEITIFITDSAGSAGYTLSAVDSNGDPLMTIEPGQTFELILSTEDLTATPTGVFSAFADIVYQTEMVSVNGDVVHSDTYPSGTNADLLAGLIDEAGGVDGITDLGAGVFEVLRVPMIAADNLADGTPITFGTNPTENLVTHPTLLFGDTDNVAPSEIRYGTLDLVVDTGVNSGGGGQGTAPDLVDYFFQVDTASSNGANVGTIVGSDADGDALSYSIFSGNANGTFAINSATGQITVANSTNLASATPAVLTVSASDGSNTTMSEVQILATTSSIEASYTLSAEDTNGNEITSVAPGQTIDLIMSVQDTRVAPTGIFSAFADIGYHASSVSIAGNVTHSLTYGSGTNAVLDGAGLIDEAGGVDGITPLGGAVIEVLRVPMVVAASANGQIAFATNPTEDGIAHPTLLFGASANLENEFINYGSLVLDVATVSTATSSFNFDIDSVTEDDSTGDYDVLDAVFGDL